MVESATKNLLDPADDEMFQLRLELDFAVGSPLAGSLLSSSAEGLSPGSVAVLELRSTPRELDRRVVDANGAVGFESSMPSDVEPGVHRLILSGVAADGSELFATAAFEVGVDGVVSAVVEAGGTTGEPASESDMRRALSAGVPVYDLYSHLGSLIALGVAAGVVATVAGGGRREDDEEDAASPDSQRDESARGEIGGVETKSMLSDSTEVSEWGDRDWRWRSVGDVGWRGFLDSVARRSGRWSAVIPRVVNDGHWFRSVVGGTDFLVVLVSFAVGLLGAVGVGGDVAIPGAGVVAVIIAMAVLNAANGLAAFIGFAIGFGILGGVPDLFEARTLLGVLVLFVSPALLANSIRPIRRPNPTDRMWYLDRCSDYLMSPIFTAYGIAGLYSAVNGLSGLELVDATSVDTVKYLVFVGVVVRMIAEDLTVRWFPARLRDTSPTTGVKMFRPMAVVNIGLKAGLFLVGAGTFFGLGWRTWVVVALMSVIPLAKLGVDRYPNLPWLHRWFPRGVLRGAIMLFVGAWFARYVVSNVAGPDEFRAAAALALVPSIVIGAIDLLARKGGSWPENLWKRFGGGLAWLVTLAALVGWISP